MSDSGLASLAFGILLVLMLLFLAWYFSRSAAVLQKWADENGYQILHKEHRYLRRGPFFWTTSRSQTVFYMEVLDQNGQRRTGYVRCGSFWLGVLNDQVEARWDE